MEIALGRKPPIQVLLWLMGLSILPIYGMSQNNLSPASRDTFNIGFAAYTQGSKPGTLHAIWNYANVYYGKGFASGMNNGGFQGKYHIKYYLESGEFSDEYDLVIEKSGKFYNLSWFTEGKLSARGVGMVLGNHLTAGWRRVSVAAEKN